MKFMGTLEQYLKSKHLDYGVSRTEKAKEAEDVVQCLGLSYRGEREKKRDRERERGRKRQREGKKEQKSQEVQRSPVKFNSSRYTP
jgi:hypothetical protein